MIIQHPPLTIVVAAGIIEHQGRLLITKRKPGAHLEGLWEFPGGKQEKGESLIQCLNREIWEELRVTVSSPVFFAKVRHQYSEIVVELHAFRCALISGIPQRIGCADLAWVQRDELPRYPFPVADQIILEKLNNEVLE